MAISSLQRQRQTELFARRAYDRAAAAKQITRNTQKLIDNALKQGATPNNLKDILAKEARKAENYARTIARTDATRIENQARQDAFEDVSNALTADYDILLVKTWTAIMDARTRDSHAALNGQEQLIDDRFSNGGAFPGDPQLPAEELFNCRCSLVGRIEGVEDLTAGQRADAEARLTAILARLR